MNWEETKAFLSPCFPPAIRDEMELLLPGELREIRIRADRETVFCTASRTAFLPWQPDQSQVEALTEALSEHSLHARGEETRQGFITLRGGHRMGLCGHVTPRGLRDVASLCIRIAGQWSGCARGLLPHWENLLLIGPPGSGKTTLLRDLARLLASGRSPRQVAVIDERGELAACVRGVPQLDVGESCDVLDGCPKPQAVAWLVRSMCPQVIVTDELSGPEDAAALLDAMACGASVIASCHGASLAEVANRPAMAALMSRRAFQRYAVLSPEGGGKVAALYDRAGSPVQP